MENIKIAIDSTGISIYNSTPKHSGVNSMDNIANLEFKRVIPIELLRLKKGAEFVYNVDHGGFYE